MYFFTLRATILGLSLLRCLTFSKLQQACLPQIVASLSLWMVAASAALFSTPQVRRHVPLSGSFVPQLAAVAAALLIAPVLHYDGLMIE